MSRARRRRFLILLAALISASASGQQDCASLAIEVRGFSREYCYTNKATAFLYGESLSRNRTGWHGFHVGGDEVLDDYEIVLEGAALDRAMSRVLVRPDHLLRIYPDGTRERVLPFDHVPAFAVEIGLPRSLPIEFFPSFSYGSTTDELQCEIRDSVAIVTRRSGSGSFGGRATWLALYAPGLEVAALGKDAPPYPVKARSGGASSLLIVFAAGETADSAYHLARRCAQEAGAMERSRTARMDALLAASSVVTGDERFNRALAWAKLSLDALMMNQGGPGIFAGLPWFNNYWGRDTFISLPGAALVTCRFPEARAILASFSLHQEHDSSSSDYGRIPNYVGPAGRSFNTADGTPRFAMMVREYIERSGDLDFGRDMYPIVRRSIEGTLRYHMDSLGFLVHGDAETWMDAAGPDGPWSPRGTRANDIQALWEGQLGAGLFLARMVGDTARLSLWRGILTRLRANFAKHFMVGERLSDHLNADHTPDRQTRPNQIFAASMLSPRARASVVEHVIKELTYPYGVSSLSPRDSLFHPFHVYPQFYPKDAAYHNGTVWTWLAGPVISELVAHDAVAPAWALTEDATGQILELGGVGTQSELLDAIPRAGESRPRLSGTVSQAWNLAEYIRNLYDDYLGLRVDMMNREIMLRPRLPESLDSVQADLMLPAGRLRITAHGDPCQRICLDATGLQGSFRARLDPNSRSPALWNVAIRGGTRYEMLVDEKGVSAYPETHSTQVPRTKPSPINLTPGSLQFLLPSLAEDLPALRPPPYSVISHTTVMLRPQSGTQQLVDAADQPNDDHGVGACSGFYRYPLSSHFRPGSFDLLHFSVFADSRIYRFELGFSSLSDPGWHPEYGFQLTYVAIAIDTDGIPGSGATEVGHNSDYRLPPDFAFERLVLVGGGIRVIDASGAILGAYMPAEDDDADPFASAQEARIGFSLPRDMVGEPDVSWRYVLLIGAQDDHGGSGLGEFRTVNAEASEWNGGGKFDPSCSNVYDALLVPPFR